MTQILTPIDKNARRRSLKASTIDGVFAAIFCNATGGVLLTKFLVDLDVSVFQIGLLSAIAQVVNFVQPLGAFLADRTTSRYRYCQRVFWPSRLLWLILVVAIALNQQADTQNLQRLAILTLIVVLISSILNALGGSAWMSWMAALVPRQLRGRYFGFRNSAACLTNLIAVPIMGFAISKYPGGSIQGYGMILFVGIVMGLVSLAFQALMVDVNPQAQQNADLHLRPEDLSEKTDTVTLQHSTLEIQTVQSHLTYDTETGDEECLSNLSTETSFFQKILLPLKYLPSLSGFILNHSNFFVFLLYFNLWLFAINLSMPFFSLYMLKVLQLDVSWVTIYGSIQAGIYVIVLPFWGRIADRTGNRFLMLLVGCVAVTTPLMWLEAHPNQFSQFFWLPLLHLMMGGLWAAIDLCNHNLQLEIAPLRNQSTYFALISAFGGISSAIGTTMGGILASFTYQHPQSLSVLFTVESALMFLGLLPLIWVKEPGGHSIRQMILEMFGGAKIAAIPIFRRT